MPGFGEEMGTVPVTRPFHRWRSDGLPLRLIMKGRRPKSSGFHVCNQSINQSKSRSGGHTSSAVSTNRQADPAEAQEGEG